MELYIGKDWVLKEITRKNISIILAWNWLDCGFIDFLSDIRLSVGLSNDKSKMTDDRSNMTDY